MAGRNSWGTSVSISVPDFCEERMAEFEKCGIHYIEYVASNYSLFADFPKKAKEIYDIASSHGVTIRSVHLPFSPFSQIDPAHLDSKVRTQFLEIQKPIVDAAGECGIEIAVVHPSGEPYEENTRDDRMKYSIEALSLLCEKTDEYGMKLAIENLPRTCLGRDAADMKALLDGVSGAYACFDSNHSLTDSNIDIIKAMGNRIIATHISDYDFIDERHLFPSQGKNNWTDIMKALEDVGYAGTWNYEIANSNSFAATVYKENHNKLLSGEIK